MKTYSRLALLRARYQTLAARVAAPLPSDSLAEPFHPLPRASHGKFAEIALARHERRQLAREVFAYRCVSPALLLTA